MRRAIPEFRTIESSAELRQIEAAVLSALLLCDEVLGKAENAIRSEQLGRVDDRLREIYPDAELP